MTPERVGEGGMTMSTATIFDLLETDADAPDSVKRSVRMMNRRQGAILVRRAMRQRLVSSRYGNPEPKRVAPNDVETL